MKNVPKREVYVVTEGNRVAGVYYWREDAQAHAQVVGGVVVVQQLRYELSVGIKVMVDAAKEKARAQGGKQQ